jgi:hypothetical protein
MTGTAEELLEGRGELGNSLNLNGLGVGYTPP